MMFVSQIACQACGQQSPHDCAYRVAWQINPHMQIGKSCLLRAARQSCALVSALTGMGAEVTRLPFVHGCFDSVFIKDNAIIKEGKALLATPKFHERAGEQSERAKQLEKHGIRITQEASAPLEGGDVVMLPNAALLGIGPRSSLKAAKELAAFIDAPVLPLELTSPDLYHLDTALGVLSDGTVIACREAFTPLSWQRLHHFADTLIEAPKEDALRFGLNWVEVGNEVIVGAYTPRTFDILRACGKKPVFIDLSEFILAGGSAACLVAKEHHAAARRVSPATPLPVHHSHPRDPRAGSAAHPRSTHVA